MFTARRACFVIAMLLGSQFATTASAQITFDPNTSLSAAEQQRLLLAHAEALRSVEEALAYLRGNAKTILEGNNPLFQQHFGQYYDRTSANPLLGQYSQSEFIWRVSPELTVADTASSTSASFPADTPYRGDLLPTRGAYITVLGDVYNELELGGVVFLTSVATTTTSVTIGDETFEGNPMITSITYPTSGIAIPNPLDAQVHAVNGFAQFTDPTRYEEIVDTLEQIRSALLGDIQISDAVDNVALINAIMGGSGSFPGVSRGFEQYGFSNSGSNQHLQNLLAQALDPTVDPLEWWEDNLANAEDEFGNPIPQEDLLFLREQFLLLAQQDINGLNLIVGDAAMRENQVAGGLFDSDPRNDRVQTSPLAQLLIEAIADGLGLGSHNRDELNATVSADGTANIDAATGEAFPQHLDVGNISDFITNASQVQQGGIGNSTTVGPPQGKNVIASPFGHDLLIPVF